MSDAHADLMRIMEEDMQKANAEGNKMSSGDATPEQIKDILGGIIQDHDEMKRFREMFSGKLSTEQEVKQAGKDWEKYLRGIARLDDRRT